MAIEFELVTATTDVGAEVVSAERVERTRVEVGSSVVDVDDEEVVVGS